MNRDVQELYKHVLIEGSANVKSVYLLYTNLAKNYNHVLLLLPFLSQLESLSFGSKRHKFERISIIDQPNFYGERSFSLEKRLSTIVQNLIGFDYLPCLFQIGQLLLNLPALKTIDFSYSFSNFERLTEFFPVFLNIKTIETLNFSGITAKDEEIHILFRILAEMPNLTSLEMNDCGLNNENINELNAFTGKATLLDRLKVLSIRNSYFKDKNNSNITNVIEKCSKLEMLDLSSCNLSEKGMWNMQYALMSQIKLKKLYLANNKLAKTGEYFLAFLPRLINLEHLDISNNNIGTAYVRKIIDILPCSIELLDISNNNKNLDIFLSINQRIKH